MNDQDRPVSQDELHAFADGLLEERDRDRVQLWLQGHPEDAEIVAAWQDQNSRIRAMFAPFGRPSPADADLLAAKPSRTVARRWLPGVALAAATLLVFSSGALTGHLLFVPRPVGNGETRLHDEASAAFLIYTGEVRHPVEVTADDQEHLVAWLGKRLGHKFSAPDLSATGFSLVGGRLVPVNNAAGALLMYENSEGKRLTVLVGKSAQDAITSFRFAANGLVETFYWIDDKLSYAVSGEIPRETLRKVADDCYRQFQS